MEPREVTIRREIDRLQRELDEFQQAEPMTPLKEAVRSLALNAKSNGINSAKFTEEGYEISVSKAGRPVFPGIFPSLPRDDD